MYPEAQFSINNLVVKAKLMLSVRLGDVKLNLTTSKINVGFFFKQEIIVVRVVLRG